MNSSRIKTYAEVNGEEVDVLVAYSITGRNRPATRIDTPEYAELEIEGITRQSDGRDVYELLGQGEFNRLEDECWQDANDRVMEAADAANDARKDKMLEEGL